MAAGLAIAWLARMPLALALGTTVRMEETVLSANLVPTPGAQVGSTVHIISEEDLAREGQLFLVDYLARIPGVTYSRAGPPWAPEAFRIRGARDGYILVRVDGIDVSDPSSPPARTELANLLAGDVERIEVLAGSQSLLYGSGAVGGVIDITTRRAGDAEGVSMRVDAEIGTHSSRRGTANYTWKGERATAAFSIQHLRSGDFSHENEIRDDTGIDGYENSTFGFNAGFDASEDFRLTVSARRVRHRRELEGPLCGGDSACFPHDARGYAEGWYAGMRVSATSSHLDGHLEHRMSLLGHTARRRHLPEGDDPRGLQAGTRQSAEYLASWLGTRFETVAGFEWGAERADVTKGATRVEGDARTQAAFVQTSAHLIESMVVSGGLRRDRHSEFGDRTSSRATFALPVPGGAKLRGSAATGFRTPSVSERFHPSYGNSKLRPETSRGYDLGLDLDLGAGGRLLSVSTTWFRIDTADPIDYDLATGRYHQTKDSVRRNGITLAADLDLSSRTELGVSRTWMRTQDPMGRTLPNAPGLDSTLRLSTRPTEHTTLSLDGQYVAGAIGIHSETFERMPLASCLLVGARAGWRFRDGGETYLRAENLLDRECAAVHGPGAPGLRLFGGIRFAF